MLAAWLGQHIAHFTICHPWQQLIQLGLHMKPRPFQQLLQDSCLTVDPTGRHLALSSCSYGLHLFLLSIDEGIAGYRDDSLETVKRNEAYYGIPLKVSSSGSNPPQLFPAAPTTSTHVGVIWSRSKACIRQWAHACYRICLVLKGMKSHQMSMKLPTYRCQHVSDT